VGELAGILEGAALDRVMGLSTGANVASVDTISILVGPNSVFPEFPTITAAEATIAAVAMATIVTTDIAVLAVAAIAIVLAPIAVEVPVEIAALTAID
jgi:hypothetical protein